MQHRKPHIMILGGGFGGLEAAFYLRRRLKNDVEIKLISNDGYFLYRPNTIYVPFGHEPEELKLRLDAACEKQAISFSWATAKHIDPENKIVSTGDGQHFEYDYLIIATGVKAKRAFVPGLDDYAYSILTLDNMLRLRDRFNDLLMAARSRRHQDVLFLLPPNNVYTGPLYEMAMMLDTWLREHDARDQITLTWATYETHYLQQFGPRLHEEMTYDFSHRDIHQRPNYVVKQVEEDKVAFTNGINLAYDLLVTLPPVMASTIFTHIPADDDGFIPGKFSTGQIIGHPDIYVVGDTSRFAVKQAYIAALQGAATAEHIASRVNNSKPRFQFEPMSMMVLEQLNRATFAQVPLKLGLAADADIDSPHYRVGTTPFWRAGKATIGNLVMRRFREGKPLHSGLRWLGMDAARRLMAQALAH